MTPVSNGQSKVLLLTPENPAGVYDQFACVYKAETSRSNYLTCWVTTKAKRKSRSRLNFCCCTAKRYSETCYLRWKLTYQLSDKNFSLLLLGGNTRFHPEEWINIFQVCWDTATVLNHSEYLDVKINIWISPQWPIFGSSLRCQYAHIIQYCGNLMVLYCQIWLYLRKIFKSL